MVSLAGSRRLLISLGLSICVLLGMGIAKAAPPPLSLYGSLPGFETASLSPSGDKIALIGVAAEQRRLIVMDLSSKPLLVAPLGDQKVSHLTWGGDDNVLIGIRATASLGIEFTADRAEVMTYVVVPLKSGKPWHVFKGSSTIFGGVQGFFGTVQRGDRWFGYFSAASLERSRAGNYLSTMAPDLYEVDLADTGIKRIARRIEADSAWRDWLIDHKGSIVGTFDRFTSSSGTWRLRDAGGKVVASGEAELGDVGLIGIGRTANTLLYTVKDRATGNFRWMEAGGSAPEEILADKAVVGALIDDKTHQLIGYIEDGDHPMARFFDARRTKVMEATRRAFSDMKVRLVDWNPTFDRLIVTTEGPGDSGTWWIVDIKTGNANIIGRSYPMNPEQVGPVRMIRYKASDGLEIAAVLTLPPGREPKTLPVVVLPHGGPSSRDYPGFDWWAQALASRGYAVFQPNFRGSSGYGPAFERAGHGEWGRKMQTDVSDGLAELARQGIVDPKRACIMGASYGGYAALAGVTLQQGFYRCAVSVAGVSDVAKMIATENRESGYNSLLRRSLNAEVGSGRDLKLVSPANFADKADAPVLLIHGKDDTVVTYGQSQIMEAALRKAGKPVELVTLPNEDHWLSRGATRLAMLEAAIAFVEKHNPPDRAKD